jgi:pantoate--beta-alanine ligase
MLVFEQINDLSNYVKGLKNENKTIGLLPTMGALHEGHLSLLEKAKAENDIVICSVFVNPIQFNNKEDFKKYPRDIEADKSLLEEYGCHVAFVPSEEEVYSQPATEQYDFGMLDKVLEGKARPGHFNGVATIVKRLFEWTKADRIYFGEKDYQQVAIIKNLIHQYSLPVQIVVCPVHRDVDGLATSSRNRRLSAAGRAIAPKIHQILVKSATFTDILSLTQIKNFIIGEFKMYKDLELEYFELVDALTLQPVIQKSENGVIGCIAVWLDGVRLIDIQRYC